MTTTEIMLTIGIIIMTVLMVIILVLMLTKKSGTNDEFKGRNQQEILSKIETLKTEFKAEIEKQNLQSKNEVEKTFNYFKEAISTKLSTDLQAMNEKVETRLKAGFESSDNLFKSMIEKLTVIDTTQQNIQSLASGVNDLKTYLSDKKSRGMYGEVQLYQILDNVFGENNTVLFSKQHKLSTGVMVDALVYGGKEGLNIPIDSKFSLENYIKLYDDNLSADAKQSVSKLFEQNIKKHIDDISTKYIIKNETSNYALMFVPSEAVFSEIQANYAHLVDYGHKKKVLITSATTLVYMLTMILVINQNIEKEKNAEKMLEEINKLFNDFRLFFERWTTFTKELKRLTDSMDNLSKPMNRLNKKVYKIEKADFENLNIDE